MKGSSVSKSQILWCWQAKWQDTERGQITVNGSRQEYSIQWEMKQSGRLDGDLGTFWSKTYLMNIRFMPLNQCVFRRVCDHILSTPRDSLRWDPASGIGTKSIVTFSTQEKSTCRFYCLHYRLKYAITRSHPSSFAWLMGYPPDAMQFDSN